MSEVPMNPEFDWVVKTERQFNNLIESKLARKGQTVYVKQTERLYTVGADEEVAQTEVKMPKVTTLQVRQVLMNEFGVSRKNVETEIEQILQDSISKIFAGHSTFESRVERAIENAVVKAAASYGTTNLKQHVERQLDLLLKEQFMKNLKLSVSCAVDIDKTKPEA